MKTQFNRTVILVGLMLLAAFLAYVDNPDIIGILQAVAAPAAIYVGVKGKGGGDQ